MSPLPPAPAAGLLIEFNVFAHTYEQAGSLPLRATWVEENGDWGRGFFLGTTAGAPGLLSPEPGQGQQLRYVGPPFFGGMSVVFAGGPVAIGDGKMPLARMYRGLDANLSFAPISAGAVVGRAALAWYFESAGGPFALTAGTRFAYVAYPRLIFCSRSRWRMAWLIVDGHGDHYVSIETHELGAPAGEGGVNRVWQSGDLTATRWARADFSRPDWYQSQLDFAGPQPQLAGLRGAGIYGAVEMPGLEGEKNCYIWTCHKLFVVGDAAAVGSAVATVPPDKAPASGVPAVTTAGQRTAAAAAPGAPAAVQAAPSAAPAGAAGAVRAAEGGKRVVRGVAGKERVPQRAARARNLTVVVVGYVLVVAGSLMLGFVGWSVWCRLRRADRG